MKYLELMQRINLLFPDVSEGMITSLFNQKSKIFQYETSYGILREYTILKTGTPVMPLDIIRLDSVKENDILFELVFLEDPNTLGRTVSKPNGHFYSVFNNTLYLYYSDTSGYLYIYTQEDDVTLYGKFVNTGNLINANTLLTTDFNDELALTCMFGLFGDLYRMDGQTIKIAEYYDGKFKENIRLYRKYGLSLRRDAEIQEHGGITDGR